MPTYVMESHSLSGAYLATLPFRNLQGEQFLTKPDQYRWDLPLHHPNITRATFFPGKTEMWLWRNGVKVFAGPVWDATASSQSQTIDCAAEGLESYFDVRRISADVTIVGTLADIAWQLIADSQAMTDGNLYITRGTTGSTISSTAKYAAKEGMYILDAINDLSASGDFDFEITADRVFNITCPRGESRAPERLEFGGNVTRYSDTLMGKFEANDILVKGPDTWVSQPTIDTAKRSEYGLRQYVDSNTSLKTQDLLNGYSERILNLRRDPREVPQIGVRSEIVNPLEGHISLGQITRLVIDDGWVQYDQDMRLTGFQVSVEKNASETFVLYLSDLREVS